jgi:hypothetical protein
MVQLQPSNRRGNPRVLVRLLQDVREALGPVMWLPSLAGIFYFFSRFSVPLATRAFDEDIRRHVD